MKKAALIIIAAVLLVGLIKYVLSPRYYPIKEGLVIRSYRLTGKTEIYENNKWKPLQEFKQK